MKRPHFALPEIYGEPLSFYEILSKLCQLLNEETLDRKNADDELQHNLNTEATTREQADTTLRNGLTTEANTREQADTALQNAINTEKSAREQADTTLQQNINTEANTREQADQVMTNNITGINQNLNDLLSSLFTVIPSGNTVPEGVTLHRDDIIRLTNEDGAHSVGIVLVDEIPGGTQLNDRNFHTIELPIIGYFNMQHTRIDDINNMLFNSIAYENLGTDRAEMSYETDDMIWAEFNNASPYYARCLYVATKNIAVGDKLEIGVNIEEAKVSDVIKDIRKRLVNLIDRERTARTNADTELQQNINSNYATLNDKIPVVTSITSTDAPLFINAKCIHFGNDLIMAFDSETHEIYFNTTGSMIEKTDWTKITGTQVS